MVPLILGNPHLSVGPEGAADLLQSIGSKDFRRDP